MGIDYLLCFGPIGSGGFQMTIEEKIELYRLRDQVEAFTQAMLLLSEMLPDEYQPLVPEPFRRRTQAEKVATIRRDFDTAPVIAAAREREEAWREMLRNL
jgi:hypothetical protein